MCTLAADAPGLLQRPVFYVFVQVALSAAKQREQDGRRPNASSLAKAHRLEAAQQRLEPRRGVQLLAQKGRVYGRMASCAKAASRFNVISEAGQGAAAGGCALVVEGVGEVTE